MPAAAAKSLQLCPTLCDPIDGSHQALRPWDSPGKNTGVGCHFLLPCMKVKSKSEVTQSCPTLRNPVDCSLPGSSIHGIFQARVLEWGAIAFSERVPTSVQFFSLPLGLACLPSSKALGLGCQLCEAAELRAVVKSPSWGEGCSDTWSQGTAQAGDRRPLKESNVAFTGDSACSLKWLESSAPGHCRG